MAYQQTRFPRYQGGVGNIMGKGLFWTALAVVISVALSLMAAGNRVGTLETITRQNTQRIQHTETELHEMSILLHELNGRMITLIDMLNEDSARFRRQSNSTRGNSSNSSRDRTRD